MPAPEALEALAGENAAANVPQPDLSRVGTRVEHVGFLVSSHNAIWHKNAMVTSIQL